MTNPTPASTACPRPQTAEDDVHDDAQPPLSWKAEFARYLIRSGPLAIVLAAHMAGFAFLVRYALDTVIPEHRRAVQEGYLAIERRQDERFELVAELLKEDREALKESSDRVGAAAESIDATARALFELARQQDRRQ